MKRITLKEFFGLLDDQGVPKVHNAFICPICGTVQSIFSVAKAIGCEPRDALTRAGYSCIGRYTGAGPHQKGTQAGAGCDWTLGGLLPLNNIEVVDEKGDTHPYFEPATPEQAKALMEQLVPSASSAPSAVNDPLPGPEAAR